MDDHDDAEAVEPADYNEIQTDEDATRIVAEFARLAEEEQRIKAQHASRLDRIKADRQALERRWLSALEDYARRRLAGGKRKSLILEDGTLAFRMSTERAEMSAPVQEALDALRARVPDQFDQVTKFEPKRRADIIALELMRQTGEIVDGWNIVPAEDRFALRFPKPGDED